MGDFVKDGGGRHHRGPFITLSAGGWRCASLVSGRERAGVNSGLEEVDGAAISGGSGVWAGSHLSITRQLKQES